MDSTDTEQWKSTIGGTILLKVGTDTASPTDLFVRGERTVEIKAADRMATSARLSAAADPFRNGKLERVDTPAPAGRASGRGPGGLGPTPAMNTAFDGLREERTAGASTAETKQEAAARQAEAEAEVARAVAREEAEAAAADAKAADEEAAARAAEEAASSGAPDEGKAEVVNPDAAPTPDADAGVISETALEAILDEHHRTFAKTLESLDGPALRRLKAIAGKEGRKPLSEGKAKALEARLAIAGGSPPVREAENLGQAGPDPIGGPSGKRIGPGPDGPSGPVGLDGPLERVK